MSEPRMPAVRGVLSPHPRNGAGDQQVVDANCLGWLDSRFELTLVEVTMHDELDVMRRAPLESHCVDLAFASARKT